MSLLYQYFSLMLDDGAAGSDDSSTPKTWFRKVNSWLPRRKKDELKECQRNRGGNILYTVSTAPWVGPGFFGVVEASRV